MSISTLNIYDINTLKTDCQNEFKTNKKTKNTKTLSHTRKDRVPLVRAFTPSGFWLLLTSIALKLRPTLPRDCLVAEQRDKREKNNAGILIKSPYPTSYPETASFPWSILSSVHTDFVVSFFFFFFFFFCILAREYQWEEK